MAYTYGIGYNYTYELGLGNTTPQADWAFISSLNAAQIESNNTGSTIVRLQDGTLVGWGQNAWGTLNTGDTTSVQTPQDVSTTSWSMVSMGYDHMLAIRGSDGALYGCGENGQYQLGTGNTTDHPSLYAIDGTHEWLFVAAGNGYSLGITSDGKLWAWGSGLNYKLGLGDTSPRSVPTQVGTDTDWAFVAAGQYHSFGIKTDGTLWGWGYNVNRQLGFASGNNYPTPTQVGTDTDWIAAYASIGDAFSHARKSDGTLWATGKNIYGQLGLGDTTQRSTFTQVGSGSWSDLSNKGSAHVLGVMSDGTLWGWGRNDDIRYLADGIEYHAPEQVGTDTDWGVVSSFSASSIAVKAGAPAPAVVGPIKISIINRTGHNSGPIKINIKGMGHNPAAIRINVLDSLETINWRARVLLGGVDISARLTGQISVDIEEGAARVAEFVMRPESGVIQPSDWAGANVVVDLVRVIAGNEIKTRMFTGVVDVPRFDSVWQTVTFSCTDDLQNKVAALDKSEIDVLVGGLFHVGAQGNVDEHWAYAQARMETVAGSLDAGPYGNPRVTEWEGCPLFATFTEDDILDETPAIDLSRRIDVCNRVNVEYEYRYYRCRQRTATISWATTIIGLSAYYRAYAQPSMDEARSAVNGLGWEVLAEAYHHGWAYVTVATPAGKSGKWYMKVPGSDQCGSFSALLGQRHAQSVSETMSMSVTAPTSISTNGELAKPLRGAYGTEWTPDEWEQDWAVDTPDASAGDVDYAGDQTRAESDACVQTLLQMAKVKILESHRHTRVMFHVPCLPEMDLVHDARIDTASIDGRGKVSRLVHRLDIDKGEATTEVTISLSGIMATGVTTPDVLDPPAQPDVNEATGEDTWFYGLPNLSNWTGAYSLSPPYSDSLMGYLANSPETFTLVKSDLTEAVTVANPSYSAGNAFPVTGFRVEMPGVDESFRNPLALPVESAYKVDIPQDPLTLTVS